MSEPLHIELTPLEAARIIEHELQTASHSLQSSELDVVQDKLVSTLGIALQLGPALVDKVLLSVMRTVRELALRADAEALSTLGPALVQLVSQVRETEALPSSGVMEAWATMASDLGTIIGQVGLALSIEPARRQAMMANARVRAGLVDDVTGGRYAMTAWIEQITPGC